MWLHGKLLVLVLLQVAFLFIFTGAILFTTRSQTITRMMSVAVLARDILWRPVAVPGTSFESPLAGDRHTTMLDSISQRVATDSQRKHLRAELSATDPRALVTSACGGSNAVESTESRDAIGSEEYAPSPEQSRLRFVFERSLTTSLAYLTLDLLISSPAPNIAMVDYRKQTLWNLQALTQDDLVFRMIATAAFWASVALLLLVINNCAAILGVVCGCYHPTDCPPLFGSFTDVTSIRQFWGAAWHQCLRVGLTTHANLLVERAFRITRETVLSKYIRLWCAFMISGLIHHSSDVAMGMNQTEAGSALFFSLQPLGIMVEDGFQAFLDGLPSKRRGQITNRARLLSRLWVIFFLVWSTPTWSYPQQRLEVDAGMLLPARITPIIIQAVARLLPATSI